MLIINYIYFAGFVKSISICLKAQKAGNFFVCLFLVLPRVLHIHTTL